MIAIENTEENIIYTRASGKLTKEDYDKLLPVLHQKEKEYEKIRWYFEMKNFEGWEPKAAWEDLKFDFKNAASMEKVAMVGEKEWEEKLSLLMKPFTSAKVEYFDLSQKVQAKQWIQI